MIITTGNILLIGSILLIVSIVLSKAGYRFGVPTLLVFLISNLRILLAIQFTHVAAVCGAAAIFCFMTADTKDADWKNSKDALQRGMQKLKGGYPADQVYKKR